MHVEEIVALYQDIIKKIVIVEIEYYIKSFCCFNNGSKECGYFGVR